MVSKRKSAANRKNAQLSTGPKDTSKSRYNAVKHGISSEQAVVPAVDGPGATERFDATLDGLRQEFRPQGTLEESFVDQIAVALVQRRRMLAYESAVIESQAEASITKWIERSQVERATIELLEMEAALARLDEPDGLSQVADPTFLMNFLGERWSDSGESALGEAIETRIEGERLISTYSLEANQDLINFAYEQSKLSEDDLRAQFKEYLGQQIHLSKKQLEIYDKQLERRRGLASLPDDAELNRILKYHARTDRGLYKSLHELQRLQAARQGEHPLLPAMVDVTVDVALNPDDTLAAEVATMDDEERIVSADPDGQLEAPEVGRLSETPSGSRLTNKHSAEANEASQSIAPEKECKPADAEPESQQRSAEDWRRLITPKRKGVTLKDFLGEAEVARLLPQRNVDQARNDDSGERPAAG